jgi:hypothetical protein
LPKATPYQIVLAAMVGAAALAASARSATFYVNNLVGHDRYDGRAYSAQGSGVGPVKSVQTAIRRAQSGDVVVLLPTGAPYTEPIVVPARSGLGAPGHPLTIEGNGVELVGFRPIDPYHWDYASQGVYRLRRPFQPTGVLFSLSGALRRKSCELWGPMPSLERGEYAFWAGRYYVRPARPFGIADYALAESFAPAGVVVDRTSHVVIRNLRIRGFRDDAVQVKGPAEGVRIERCLLAENGRAGFSATTNTSVDMVGCFVTGNVKFGLVAENHARLTLESCVVEANGRESRMDDTASVQRRGGPPEPLRPGPFLAPEHWDRAEPPLDLTLPEEVRPTEP